MSDPGASAPAFSLMAPVASSIAGGTDRIFWTLLGVTGAMGVLLAALVVGFAWRYRAGRLDVDRSRPPSEAGRLEVAWTVAPMLLFLALFAWAAHAYVVSQRVPADALPVHVVAKQWMWRLEHPTGRQEIDELHVPQGRPVVLVMASQDVIHSFYVPAFRLKQDVVPGRYTRLWFTATALGTWPILCTEYCGSQHSAMLGRVVVMRPDDYARWAESGPAPVPGSPTPAQLGAGVYARLACGSCHDAASSVHAPPLAGLYGRPVTLADGTRVVADDDYLRRSILAPRSQVVAGQPNAMPSYAGQVPEEDLLELVAYLRSLGGEGR